MNEKLFDGCFVGYGLMVHCSTDTPLILPASLFSKHEKDED